MTFEGNYKIMVQNEDGLYDVCVRRTDDDMVARFDCVYTAEQYAKLIGLKSGYIIKKQL